MTGFGAFTLFHVVLSLIGIGSGLVVLAGFLNAKLLHRWTALFLATTVLTNVTGFLFPFHGFLPSYGVATLSLIALAIAIAALYGRHLAGAWRKTYVITAMLALYLNVFVLVVQLFRRVPALEAAAPTQSEPPFIATQVAVVIVFTVLTVFAVVKFRAKTLLAV